MSNAEHKKRPLKFWLLLPITLPVAFVVMDNCFYKRLIFAAYLILAFVLMRVAILIPYKMVAVAIISVYFFAVMPFMYYGLLKDYMSTGLSKTLAVLLAIATMFAAMAATSGL